MNESKRQPAAGPDAKVVPTPFKLHRVETACSRWGNFLKAFLLSVCTALGVLILTRLVSWGKNLPLYKEMIYLCYKRDRETGKRERSQWAQISHTNYYCPLYNCWLHNKLQGVGV